MHNRKQQVLLTAKQLFIQNGFFTTTIQDILNQAKISKGTFYNYFSSKNECLIEILKYSHEEISVRRRELLMGKDPSDKSILAEQILIRFKVNQEQNLMPIFQAIFHSGDAELREFIHQHHFQEINWLAYRFIDVYGNTAKKVAFDCSVLFLGMVQQLFQVLKAGKKEDINPAKIIHFTIRRMDTMIVQMTDSNDTLLKQDMFSDVNEENAIQTFSKEQLHSHLIDFQKSIKDDVTPDCKQQVQFMIDEICAKKPRVFILQSVLRSFRESFGDTIYTRDAQDISVKVWEYVETLE